MRIQEMVTAVTPTRWPRFSEINGAVLSAAALYAALAAFGIGISWPWPARADVEKVQTDIQLMQSTLNEAIKQQKVESCMLYRILRDGYRKDESEADADLVRNPNSTAAKRQKTEAVENIAEMNAKLHAPPCV